MAWKIPTWSDGIGAIVGSIPRIIKHFKDKGRINAVNKIDAAVDSGDDAAINKLVHDAKKKYEDGRKADA